MHFTITTLSLLIASTALATPLDSHSHQDSGADIFPNFNTYSDWAICKGKITKGRFPTLQAPNNNGGCVRMGLGLPATAPRSA
ncbi:hypothetical protein FocTR4_00006112 [Fusarium oxysporum f. sp. cubense]|uniref:Uncharacterized protein n=1 Tax=Fusarium oxysporum f. sp. cubense TaxID=61366 RepID=A0A5C6THE4_FUSOC|nr:hypothetical protein FocTR4_00006112 [Fusarium oxysporum f. sp. cubense]